MGIINVTGIKLYAYHGCLEEEAIIGGQYVVDVKIETDFLRAQVEDDLTQTVDYVTVYNIVKAQMAIRSKLIEHAAALIAGGLIKQIPAIQHVEVKVTKINPPMNGDVKEVSVTVMAGT
ncbi:MAG: dihydroneopterin aldolase [Bacteroidetes bacterium]|nr:dihydroneopterin aldolase [Bacteroidota bacterium]